MQSLSEVSITDFRAALTPLTVRTSKIIHLALAAGVSTFAIIVLYVYSGQLPLQPEESDISFVNTLTILHFVVAVTCAFAGRMISEKQFSASNLEGAVTRRFTGGEGQPLTLTPAEKCLTLIRTASILQLAMLEAGAFLGLVVTMIAATNGVLHAEPLYFINLLSSAIIIVYVALTFPTEDRLESIFKQKIQKTE